MSRGYYDRRKKRILIYIIVFSMVLFLVIGFTLFFQYQKKTAAEYGSIQDIDVTSDDTLEETKAKELMPIDMLVIDCGDALSVLIDYGQTEVLYDAGYAEDGEDIVKKISGYVDGEIDYLIVSHSHADHCGGVPAVLSAYGAKTIITSGEKEGNSSEFKAAQKAIKGSGAEVIEDKDMTIDLGEGFTLDIVETLDPDEEDNPNNLSVVAYLKRENTSILLEGDAEKEAEKTLKGKFPEGVTVFVAGHHMSDTSNSAVLLEEWRPAVIIASCAGPNKSEYGFPNRKALLRCLAVTSEVYATYISGDITVTLNDAGYEISAPMDERLELTN